MKRAVAAVIQQDDKVLLARRSMQSRGQPGKWENAGGQVDSNESADQAIIREIKEELGVDFIIEKILLEDKFPNDGEDWYVTIYGGTIKGEPRAMIPEETSEVQWFKISELKDVDLATYTKTDFKKFGWLQPND